MKHPARELDAPAGLRMGLGLLLGAQALLFLWLLAAVGGAQSDAPAAAPELARMPRAVTSFGACELDGWIYLSGGHAGRAHRYSEASQWDGFVRLKADDPAVREELPGGSRAQSTALVAARGALLRLGGMRVTDPEKEGQPGLRSLADAERFDPVARSWSALPPLPEPRSSHDALALGGRVYVLGGWNLRDDSDAAHWFEEGLVLDLDAARPEWKPIAQPFQRRGLSVSACAGEIYAVGGMTSADEITGRVDVLDPERGTWREAPAFPDPGFGVAVVTVGERVVGTGQGGRVWALAPGDAAWEELGALAVPRIFHRVIARGDELVVLGGSCGGSPVTWIERFPLAGRAPSCVLSIPFAGRARQRQAAVLAGDELSLFGGNVALEQHAFEPEDFLDEAWAVSLTGGTASAQPALPTPRQSMVCLADPGVKGATLALGGFGHDGEIDRSWDEVWRCAPTTRAWTRLDARLPAPMTQFRTLVHGSDLFLLGGMDFDRERKPSMRLSDAVFRAPADQVEAGFTAADWRLPAPRRAFGAALLGERAYVVGGLDAEFTAVTGLDAYDFGARAWVSLRAPATARVSPELVALGERLYLVGGLTFDDEGRSHAVQEIEEFDPAAGAWRTLATPLPIDAHETQAFAWRDQLAVLSTWNERGTLEVALVDPCVATSAAVVEAGHRPDED